MPSWRKIMGMDARVPAAGDLPDRGTRGAVATTVGRDIPAVEAIMVDRGTLAMVGTTVDKDTRAMVGTTAVRRTQVEVATIAANPTPVDTTMTEVGAITTGTVGIQGPTDITVLPMPTALRIMDLTIAIRAGTTTGGVIGMSRLGALLIRWGTEDGSLIGMQAR